MEIKTEPTPEIESWQPTVLTVRVLKQSYWLVDSVADLHVCNNKRLMINYTKNPIKLRRLT